jgi:hypothetical protein
MRVDVREPSPPFVIHLRWRQMLLVANGSQARVFIIVFPLIFSVVLFCPGGCHQQPSSPLTYCSALKNHWKSVGFTGICGESRNDTTVRTEPNEQNQHWNAQRILQWNHNERRGLLHIQHVVFFFWRCTDAWVTPTVFIQCYLYLLWLQLWQTSVFPSPNDIIRSRLALNPPLSLSYFRIHSFLSPTLYTAW